jgi:hypothetical protein
VNPSGGALPNAMSAVPGFSSGDIFTCPLTWQASKAPRMQQAMAPGRPPDMVNHRKLDPGRKMWCAG